MNRSCMVLAVSAALTAGGYTPTQKLQAAAGYQELTRTMLATDPNRDPNWDWTQDVTYTLVTTTQTYEQVRLPYFSGSGPAAAALNVPDGRDIRREDGWRLVLRDFGPGAEQAFFILYNRNRGIFRVFYYHANAIYSHAVGTLRFQDSNPAESAAHMTLDDKTDRYVSNYDPERALVAVGAMGTGWCYLDFSVTGSDPTVHLKADPSFVIQITGVTSTDIVLSGDIDLTQRTASTQRKGGDGFQATDVLNVYKHVAQRYKDVNDARETFEKMAKLNPDEKWADFILNTIGSLGNQKWLSALGPVGGIVELAIGGGSGKQPAPLIYDGTLSLKGELTTEAPLYQITMRVPGSRHLDPVDKALNVLPLYDLPLGIFNVAEAPQYDLYKYQTIYDWTKNNWTGTTVSAITKPLIVEANLHVFGTVAVKANHIIAGGWLAGPYRSVSTFNSSNVSNGYIADGFDDPFAFNFNTAVGAARLAVQATLTPLDAPPDVEPITVIKTYSPPKTLKAWPPPAFNSVPRRPARPSSLVATPGASGGIDLKWLDNAGNETGIVVEEIVSAYPTNMIATIATLPAGTTSYHVGGGIPGMRYFRVRATNGAGSSPSSNQAASVAGGSCPPRCF